jgi:predicted RNA-binding Zn-ribbon protein involved in translation (DUF1610 family)
MSEQEWDITHYLTPRELNTASVFISDDSFMLACPSCGSNELLLFAPIKYVSASHVADMMRAQEKPESALTRFWHWFFPKPAKPARLPYGYVSFRTKEMTLECVGCDDVITVPDEYVKFMSFLSVGDIYVG